MKPQFRTLTLTVGGLLLLGIALAFMWTLSDHHELTAWRNQPVPEVIKGDFYLAQVQPVFTARCIACHSCFNSPCQLDLTSYEGVQRGGSKANPYDFPLLKAQPTTRLGIDAHSEADWRAKGFHSVLDGNAKSILAQFLKTSDKSVSSAQPSQSFHAETSRMCPSTEPAQIKAYFDANPQGQMPFGFPALAKNEREILTKWLAEGARGPSAESATAASSPLNLEGEKTIQSWEKYFNETPFKSRLVSRYIYEHLFLAHIYFDTMPGEFFRLIRAKNETGVPDEIATRRPYDDPGPKFFYRFKKYTQAVVAKTHMPYELTLARKERWQKLFFDVQWAKGSDEMPTYGPQAANAFEIYKRIPPESRYRFLLDSAYYHISTFIKGPVCRGSTALSVINDHFWVIFAEPSTDPSVKNQAVIDDAAIRMVPPAATEDRLKLFGSFRDGYWEALHKKYSAYKSEKNLSFSPSMIWNGDRTNPNALLTVYRHFDSAEVLMGAYGAVPDTVWVIDYQVFEDIYYNLVAGYDVFSPMIHQLNTRLYMEITRIASEDMFLNYLPQKDRANLRASWNRDTSQAKKPIEQKIIEFFGKDVEAKMAFEYPYLGTELKSSEPAAKNPVEAKNEFLARVFNDRFTKEVLGSTEHIAGLVIEKKAPWFSFSSKDRALERLQELSIKPAEFAHAFSDVAFLRVRTGANSGRAYTIIHNKAHSSVSMLLFEDERREPWRDTLDIVSGFAASYPNMYFDVDEKDLSTMVEKIKTIRQESDYKKIVAEYGVERGSEKFWALHDWFNTHAKSLNPIDSGYFDLNRYEN